MTKEDLEQIGKVVDARIDAKVEPLIKKLFKPVNRRLKKIEHGMALMLKYHDEMYIEQRKRIERLEEHAALHRN